MRSVTQEEIEALARAAVTEMQATLSPGGEQHEVAPEELDQERQEEERYFQEVAMPLGEAMQQAGIVGSDLIAEDRDN